MTNPSPLQEAAQAVVDCDTAMRRYIACGTDREAASKMDTALETLRQALYASDQEADSTAPASDLDRIPLKITDCLATIHPKVKGKFPAEQALEELAGIAFSLLRATLSSTAPVASEPEAIAQLRHLCEDLIVKYQDGGLDRYMVADGKGLLFSNMASACIRLLAAPQTPSPVAPEPFEVYCAKRAAGVALQVGEREALQSWPQLRDYNRALVALKAILAEPHGCVFCDSGKLRNPAKPHEPDCGFELARAALAGDQAEKDQA